MIFLPGYGVIRNLDWPSSQTRGAWLRAMARGGRRQIGGRGMGVAEILLARFVQQAAQSLPLETQREINTQTV